MGTNPCVLLRTPVSTELTTFPLHVANKEQALYCVQEYEYDSQVKTASTSGSKTCRHFLFRLLSNTPNRLYLVEQRANKDTKRCRIQRL